MGGDGGEGGAVGWGGGCSVGMGVARWRESYISVMVLDVGASEYCMLIGASVSSKMWLHFVAFKKIFCLDWDVFHHRWLSGPFSPSKPCSFL